MNSKANHINEQSDEELAGLATAGNQEAFTTLYERYFERLYDFLVRLTSDPDQAADIAQDAFVKLLPGGTEHPPQSNFRSWLYTVARNTAIDRIRSRKRQVSIPDMEDGDLERLLNRTASQPADGPEDAVMNQEIAALVWEAAKGLDPDDYSLLDLNLRQQLEPQEVARVLGIKPGNAYTKLSRLKDRMEQAVNALLMVRHGRND